MSTLRGRALALSASAALAGCSLVYAGDLDDAREVVPGADGGSLAETGAVNVAETGTDAGSDASGPRTYADEVLADKPAAYWRLEESEGTLFADEIADHDLVLGSVTAVTHGVPGVAGSRAIALKGEAASLQVSDLPNTPVFTIEAWVRRDFDETRYGVVFEKNTITNDLREGMLLWVNPGREVQSAFEIWKDQTVHTAALGGPVPKEGFTHLVVTRDETTRCRMYLNGGQTGETGAPRDLPNPSPILAFGDRLTGDLDELAVYPTALSSDRIIAHALAGR